MKYNIPIKLQYEGPHFIPNIIIYMPLKKYAYMVRMYVHTYITMRRLRER